MKIKKILLFIVAAFFMFSINVNAKTIICDYDNYKVMFYTDRYGDADYANWYDIYDKNGNIVKEQINKFKPMKSSDCPSNITIDRVSYALISSKVKGLVSCGNVTDIPRKIPELISMAITLIQIAVPVILVVMGSLDLFKGVTAQKEDEIKKGQQLFVKRLIVAAIIFFVVVIVKFVISIVAEASSTNIIECIDCFLSNNCN